jgi:hypothetical protein
MSAVLSTQYKSKVRDVMKASSAPPSAAAASATAGGVTLFSPVGGPLLNVDKDEVAFCGGGIKDMQFLLRQCLFSFLK